MVELDQVGYRIGQKWIVRDINLKIESGEFWVFAGPNGAGKSTLLRLISGELSPQKGEIRPIRYTASTSTPRKNWREAVPTSNRNAMSTSRFAPWRLCCLDAIPT